MFRTALLRSARLAIQSTVRQPRSMARGASPFIRRNPQFAPAFTFQSIRCYSAPVGLSREEVEGRIMDLLKNFDKVQDASKISSSSHFLNDLGLDSLDTVEVVMAIEEEFSIEIPDKDADAIHSLPQAVEYILSQPDGRLTFRN
ncbi:MAG: putative secondary metabolism biosynthetic enzyme [Trizodia sp. TS-e1964]|nr:MAG: putative secondary metabolism biosynthetic enzyme [Trizodia sp. TS-e1964]